MHVNTHVHCSTHRVDCYYFVYVNFLEQLDHSHPLLPIITECLNRSQNKRPSSHELSTQLATLKDAAETHTNCSHNGLCAVPCQSSDTHPLLGTSSPLQQHPHDSVGHAGEEEEKWLPVHVQVTGMEKSKTGKGSGVKGKEIIVDSDEEEEEFVKDREKSDLTCNGHVPSVLGDVKGGVPGTDRKALEALKHTVEKTSTALVERDAQIEEVRRERAELSASLQQLQREMLAVTTNNRRLEQELATKEKELQQLKLKRQSTCKCSHLRVCTCSECELM